MGYVDSQFKSSNRVRGGHLLEIIFEDVLNTTIELYKNCKLKVQGFEEKLKCTLCLKTN